MLWPSSLVRERAAVHLSELIRGDATRELASRAFIEWMTGLRYESLMANALLILLRLQRHGTDLNSKGLVDGFRYPSILSELMFRELIPDHRTTIQFSQLHSETAPEDYEIDPYFEKYSKSFVPPIYELHASRIERFSHIRFRRQWAYEWQLVRRRAGLGYSAPPSYFLSSNERPCHVCFDTLQSEAFRSGFLRALAWAAVNKALDVEVANMLALESCPVDLGLWDVSSVTRPDWWPSVSIIDGGKGVDTTAEEILLAVERMWLRGFDDGDFRLAYASGPIRTNSNVVYRLEIRGVFQRNLGGAEPEVEEVADFVETGTRVRTEIAGLSVGGSLKPVQADDHAANVGGWSLVKAVFELDSWTNPRWQASRWMQGCPIAAPFIADSGLRVTCNDSNVSVGCEDGEICKTFFWNDALREVEFRGDPSRTGVYMVTRAKCIRDFADTFGGTFGWLVTLSLHDHSDWGRPKQATFRRFLGAIKIVRI